MSVRSVKRENARHNQILRKKFPFLIGMDKDDFKLDIHTTAIGDKPKGKYITLHVFYEFPQAFKGEKDIITELPSIMVDRRIASTNDSEIKSYISDEIFPMKTTLQQLGIEISEVETNLYYPPEPMGLVVPLEHEYGGIEARERTQEEIQYILSDRSDLEDDFKLQQWYRQFYEFVPESISHCWVPIRYSHIVLTLKGFWPQEKLEDYIICNHKWEYKEDIFLTSMEKRLKICKYCGDKILDKDLCASL